MMIQHIVQKREGKTELLKFESSPQSDFPPRLISLSSFSVNRCADIEYFFALQRSMGPLVI